MCDFAADDAAQQLLVGRVLTVKRVAESRRLCKPGCPGERRI